MFDLPRVSDITLGTRLVRTGGRAAVAAVVGAAVPIAVALWAGPFIHERCSSPALAVTILVLHLAIWCAGAWLLALAVAVGLFGPTWRDQHLLAHTPRSLSDGDVALHRIHDRTAGFYLLLVLCLAGTFVALSIAGSGYTTNFMKVGLRGTQLRAPAPEAQIAGLRGVVAADADQRLDAAAVRARILELLDSDEPEVRAWASWAAARLRVVRAVDRLVALVSDPDQAVRCEAYVALGQLSDVRSDAGLQLTGLLRARSAADELSPAELDCLLVGIGYARRPSLSAEVLDAIEADRIPAASWPVALWAASVSGAYCEHGRVMRLITDAPARGLDAEQLCAAAEAMKRLSTVEDMRPLMQAFVRDQADDPWCSRVVWRPRSASDIRPDFPLQIVRAEQLAEKYLDATFNTAAPGLEDWLDTVYRDPEIVTSLRRHARHLLTLLHAAPMNSPRTAEHCP